MDIQTKRPHRSPLIDERERGGLRDSDGYVLSAHPGQVAGAATNNVELAAHQSERPAHPRLPSTSPCPGSTTLPTGADAVSCRDNGSCYHSISFAAACAQLRIAHSRTRAAPPTDQRQSLCFIQTLLHEWANARLYATRNERASALPTWINHYNYRRPQRQPQSPATRKATEQRAQELQLDVDLQVDEPLRVVEPGRHLPDDRLGGRNARREELAQKTVAVHAAVGY